MDDRGASGPHVQRPLYTGILRAVPAVARRPREGLAGLPLHGHDRGLGAVDVDARQAQAEAEEGLGTSRHIIFRTPAPAAPSSTAAL